MTVNVPGGEENWKEKKGGGGKQRDVYALFKSALDNQEAVVREGKGEVSLSGGPAKTREDWR